MRIPQRKNLGKILTTGLVSSLVGLTGCNQRKGTPTETEVLKEVIEGLVEINQNKERTILMNERNYKLLEAQNQYLRARGDYYEALSSGRENLEELKQEMEKRFKEYKIKVGIERELEDVSQKLRNSGVEP